MRGFEWRLIGGCLVEVIVTVVIDRTDPMEINGLFRVSWIR